MDDLFADVKLERGRVSDQIVEQFSELIRKQVLEPGQRLPGEYDLAQKFSTSRGTIREALRTLETMGLIEVRTGSGAYVTAPPPISVSLKWLTGRPEQVVQILEIRQLLQGRAAKLCAERATTSQIEKMEEIIRSMKQANREDDIELLIELDVRFHNLIGEFSGNSILNELIKHIEDTYPATSRAANMGLRGRGLLSTQEHAAILEAIKAQDGPLAEQRMHEHADRVLTDLLAQTGPYYKHSSETSE